MTNLVQLKNPKTQRYVKINVSNGSIIGHKRTEGPYKGIPIVYPDPEKGTVKKIAFDFEYECVHSDVPGYCKECYTKAYKER